MATRPPRQGGLGPSGRDRFGEGLGRSGREEEVLGDTLFQRTTPPLESSQPLRTGWIDVASSRVAEYNYDYSDGSLYLRWVKYGTTWVYENVSSALFEAFVSSPSKGKYVNSTLNLHPYHEVYDAP